MTVSWITGTQNRSRAPRFNAKKRASPERTFQVTLAKLLTQHCTTALWAAIPNGGYRHLYTAMKLRAEGARRGAPDLFFVLPGGQAAFLELKAPKGRASPEQIAFRDAARALGARWEMPRSLDEAIAHLNEWGVLPNIKLNSTPKELT